MAMQGRDFKMRLLQTILALFTLLMIGGACTSLDDLGRKKGSATVHEVVSKEEVGDFASMVLFRHEFVLAYYNITRRSLEMSHGKLNELERITLDSDSSVGRFLSMTTNNKEIFISYYDEEMKGLRVIAGVPGGSWQRYIVDDGDGLDVGKWSSIGIDQSGIVHIVYQDADQGRIRYAFGAPGKMEVQELELEPDDRIGLHSSIVIDPDDKVFIGYYNETKHKGRLVQISRNGEEAAVEKVWVLDHASDHDSGSWISLAINRYGRPSVSYYDATKGTLKLEDPLSLNPPTIVDNDGNVGMDSSLAFDGDGNAHIAYWDASSFDLKYATGSDSHFKILTLDAEGLTGFWPDIAFDVNGKPFVAYQLFKDAHHNNRHPKDPRTNILLVAEVEGVKGVPINSNF
jgi:hypothetical protein